MKKKIILLFILGLFYLGSFGQITKILEIPWNEPNGCKTEMRPDAHYGLEEFEMMNENEVAILCVVERKIKIYDLTTKSFSSEIPLRYEPRYFTYSKNKDVFYYYARRCIYEIDRTGKLINTIKNSVDVSFSGLEALHNNLYALTGHQKSYILVKENKIIGFDFKSKVEPNGLIFNEGNIIRLKKSGRSYTITSLYKNEIKTYNYSLDEKGGDIKAVGQDKEYIYIVLSYCIQTNPYKMGREILLYFKSESKVIKELPVPFIFYTAISNDIKYSNGTLYHMITTPNSANLYSIQLDNKKKLKSGIKYSDDLNYEYHYDLDYEKRY